MKKLTSLFLMVSTILFATGIFFFFSQQAQATGSLTVMSDTMSNQTASGLSTHLIKFKTPTAFGASGITVAIAFPSDFDFTGVTYSDLTMKDGVATGLETTETLGAAAGVSTWGAAFTDGACSAGKKCTLTLTSPTSGTYNVLANYYVTLAYISTHAKNATTAGSKTVTITTTSDYGALAVPIITSNTVTLDATVAPTITFTNDNSALHFGTLNSSAAQYANSTTGSGSDVVGNTFAISTNATSGYTLTYAAAPTLTSGTNTIAAATITSSATGTPGITGGQFAMDAVYTNGSGGGTLTSAYNHATPNWKFNTAGDTLVSTTGPVNADSIAMHYIANISAVTPAGVYTQTNTWIATGNF